MILAICGSHMRNGLFTFLSHNLYKITPDIHIRHAFTSLYLGNIICPFVVMPIDGSRRSEISFIFEYTIWPTHQLAC